MCDSVYMCVCVCVCVRAFGGRMARFLEHKTARCYADLGAGYLTLLKLKHSTEGCYAGKKGGWGGC